MADDINNAQALQQPEPRPQEPGQVGTWQLSLDDDQDQVGETA